MIVPIIGLVLLLNPVLFVGVMAIIWAWSLWGFIYLVILNKGEKEYADGSAIPTSRKVETSLCLLLLTGFIPLVIYDLWAELGVTLPYSILWSLIKAAWIHLGS